MTESNSASASDGSSSSTKNKRTTHLLSPSNLYDVEKELHIFCSETAVTPSFIMDKITDGKLSEKQSEYVKKVKSYLNFDIKFMELILSQSVAHQHSTTTSKTRPLKDVIKDSMESSMKDPDRFVRSTVKDFMIAVQTLARQCEEFRSQFRKTIYEGTFTGFIRDFALLCCLKPECTLGNAEGEPSVWENFRGLKCAVSNPDIRFMKRGLPDELCSNCEETDWAVVSTVKVKLPSELRFMSESGRTSLDGLARRMGFTSLQPTMAKDSSSESSSSDNLLNEKSKNSRRKKNSLIMLSGPRFLPIYNGHKVFGQHAGELLFDLNRCLKDSKEKVGRMPGMIFDGVKVIFTLLEIKVEHLEKLRKNQELVDGDRALIYYSIPYDILNQADRNMILEYFMQLNNVKFYVYDDLKATSTKK